MRTDQIVVGKTYYNRGKGKTLRKVLAIGPEYAPKAWYGGERPADGLGVRYEQDRGTGCLYLESFAQWAGGVVGDPGDPRNAPSTNTIPIPKGTELWLIACPWCGEAPEIAKHVVAKQFEEKAFCLTHQCSVLGVAISIDWTSLEDIARRWNARFDFATRRVKW